MNLNLRSTAVEVAGYLMKLAWVLEPSQMKKIDGTKLRRSAPSLGTEGIN